MADIPATVTDGIFSVRLNFSVKAFSGADRYLELNVDETYFLTVTGKHFIFANPMQVINAMEDVNDIKFSVTVCKKKEPDALSPSRQAL